MPLVPHSELLALHSAAITAGLAPQRRVLMVGIDRRLVDGISSAPDPKAQLLSDLAALNEIDQSPDGTSPLLTWTTNAAAIAEPRAEAQVFRRFIARYAPMPSPTALVEVSHSAQHKPFNKGGSIHPRDELRGYHRSYRITHLRARTNLGHEIWEAVGDKPCGDVIIKILGRTPAHPDLIRRFEREARITSSLTHPCVCRCLDVGMIGGNIAFIVFEHLVGETLADRLNHTPFLTVSEVGPIIDDALQGLIAAHGAGVIHRNLKPSKLFLVRRSSVVRPSSADQPALADEDYECTKILDFGASKLIRTNSEEKTHTALTPAGSSFPSFLGSYAYLAPEQIRGAARANERADIYSVGAIALHALSGRMPFADTTAAGLFAMKLDRDAPSLAEATGERWPASIERFLEIALARKRERRFSSAGDTLSAWRLVMDSLRYSGRT